MSNAGRIRRQMQTGGRQTVRTLADAGTDDAFNPTTPFLWSSAMQPQRCLQTLDLVRRAGVSHLQPARLRCSACSASRLSAAGRMGSVQVLVSTAARCSNGSGARSAALTKGGTWLSPKLATNVPIRVLDAVTLQRRRRPSHGLLALCSLGLHHWP